MGLWNNEEEDDEEVVIEFTEDPRERIIPATPLPPIPPRRPRPGPEHTDTGKDFRSRVKVFWRGRV